MPERHSSSGIRRRLFLPVLLALLFFGAMFWAKGRDPFQRIWFRVKVPGQGKAECIAVLPKDSPKSKVPSPKSARGRWPVVVYLHGSGGSLLGDGNELRRMAEMGLATVGWITARRTRRCSTRSSARC